MPDELQQKVSDLMASTPKNDIPKTQIIVTTTNDEYKKVKEANDLLEAEMRRSEELRAKQLLGGRSQLQNIPEKTQEEIANARAHDLLKTYGYR